MLELVFGIIVGLAFAGLVGFVLFIAFAVLEVVCGIIVRIIALFFDN